jgi:nucleoside 2-deoxyribosyltransferase
MSTIEFFGISWEKQNLNSVYIRANILSNEQIGQVAFTANCLQCIPIDHVWEEDDYYKLLALIHEKTIHGKTYFICKEEDYRILEKYSSELYEYTLVENINVLRDFPNNIIDLQRRTLLMLYKKYPRYGDNIRNIEAYEFFSKDDSDWAFVLETMQQKNWIDVKLRKASDGGFGIARPFLITEEGWLEIEKNLEMNYTKQVFVAMWFHKNMDKAAKKIEEAINDCGLKVMRIDRKEHNNEISGEILFEIMNSRIIIADVTGQRNGVYFEAGFALGHQKSVIWSCRSDDLINIHFDTRQYNHVIWESEDDLYSKLKDRLLATLAIENR